jgi:transglutaminase-like putative cysteine protease
MKLRVRHRTEYLYSEPVHHNANEVRLQPLHNEWQQRRFHVVRVVPTARLGRFSDFHANGACHFEVEEPHNELLIDVESVVETGSRYTNGRPLGASLSTLDASARRDESHMFLQDSRYVIVTPEIWRAAVDTRGNDDCVYTVAENLMRFVHQRCSYVTGITTVHTTSEQFFLDPRGVCQDYAHLMLALCRSLRIPARYVSGYLYDATHREMRGAQASHAWCEVYVPGHDWYALDPTNNRLVDDHYIAVATGRDYDDVAPVKGTFYGGGSRQLTVIVQVEEA